MWVSETPRDWDGNVSIILAHGAGQGMNSAFMNFFHSDMAARGFLSVKFNFEYMEAKRKVPDPQPKLQARYRQVIDEVRTRFWPQRIFAGGKSMGGRIASYIAGDTDAIVGLIFLGYPLHPPGKAERLRDEHLYALKQPMLFVSGTRDTLAQQDLLQSVADRLGSRATLFWIEGGDHSLKRGKDRTALNIAADEIERWVRSHSSSLAL